MSDGVFVLRDDGTLVEMSEQAYASEAKLQALLAQYPNLLAGEQIDSARPRRWLLVSREAGLPQEEGGSSWFAVDHLLVDQDAIPTLVEVKQSTNSEIRRSVVGQLLGYAANAVAHGPIEGLHGQYLARCEQEGLDPDVELQARLGEDIDPSEFWELARTNLQAGKIRLLFVSDSIPAELRKVVEFLNGQMDPAEVLAVEIKQYAGEGLASLVPRVFGQTEGAKVKKAGGDYRPIKWNEQLFFQDLSERCADGVPAARGILNWATEAGHPVVYGSGAYTGSFVPGIKAGEVRYFPVLVYSDGQVGIGFSYMKTKPVFEEEDAREQLRARLNEIDGIDIPLARIGGEPYVGLPLLADPERLRQFLAVLDWFVEEVRKGAADGSPTP